MNNTEWERFLKFKEKHDKHYHNDSLKFKISLTSTGIGWAVTVKCCGCKKKKNITDYDGW